MLPLFAAALIPFADSTATAPEDEPTEPEDVRFIFVPLINEFALEAIMSPVLNVTSTPCTLSDKAAEPVEDIVILPFVFVTFANCASPPAETLIFPEEVLSKSPKVTAEAELRFMPVPDWAFTLPVAVKFKAEDSEPMLFAATSSIVEAVIAFEEFEVIFEAFTLTLPEVACNKPLKMAFPTVSTTIFPVEAVTVVFAFWVKELIFVKFTLLAVIFPSILTSLPE